MDVENAQQVLDLLESICYTPSDISDDTREFQRQPVELTTNTNTEVIQSGPPPSSGYETAVIMDALSHEWDEETANFRDFMHKISEDLPERWTRPRRLTQMVQILVRVHLLHHSHTIDIDVTGNSYKPS